MALLASQITVSHNGLIKHSFPYLKLFLVASSLQLATVHAANFDSPAVTTDAASKMYTVNDVYNRLNAGTAGTDPATKNTFAEPAGAPVLSSKDLNEVMGVAPAVDDANGATAAEVLSGKKYWSLQSGAWGLKTGTLATQTLDPASNTLTAGNYAGTTLSTVDVDLTAANIKTGVTIFGVAGTAPAAPAYPNQVPKTGQTLCYDTAGTTIVCTGTGQDGDLLKGVAHAATRFTVNVNLADDDGGSANNGGILDGIASDGICNGSETCNGTVTDNDTGLIWLTNANCWGVLNWATALTNSNALATGSCGLTDGSAAGDWRLPNRFELESLLDLQNVAPALPTGHPFTASVVNNYYWSSTTGVLTGWTNYAWFVSLNYGRVNYGLKTSSDYVWPVRGGQ